MSALVDRRVQDVTPGDVAKLLRGMRDGYSPWTQVAAYRILAGTFALATRRGLITREPDGRARSVGEAEAEEREAGRRARRRRHRQARTGGRLGAVDGRDRARRIRGPAARRDSRASLAGHRPRSRDNHCRPLAAPGRHTEGDKNGGGRSHDPLLPALRRALVAWKLRSPRTNPENYVLCTADGGPVAERNLRRALDQAKTKANLTVSDAERLSWHSLRHSYASILATDLELPATTLARLTGHTDASFTLRVYARDGRNEATIVDDVLARAAGAGIGA